MVYDLTYGKRDQAAEGNASWIPEEAPSDSRLLIYAIAAHSAALSYANRFINLAAARKNVAVYRRWALMIDNERTPWSKAETLWPRKHDSTSSVRNYVSQLRQQLADNYWADTLFRPVETPSTEILFSSPEARDVVERAFLREGSRIRESTQKPSLRPLGFEKKVGLGVGSLVITYRNIANNCPLVLWYGGGGWFPLFEPNRRDPFEIERGRSGPEEDIDIDDMPF